MPINLDTVLAKLHVFHLCDILNAIKSWLCACAWTSLRRRETTDVINMQTSSCWQTRLGFENLNYFCVIIYLPVHRFPFLISSRVPPPTPTPCTGLNYTRRTFIYDAATQAGGIFHCDVLHLYGLLMRRGRQTNVS